MVISVDKKKNVLKRIIALSGYLQTSLRLSYNQLYHYFGKILSTSHCGFKKEHISKQYGKIKWSCR